MGLLESFRKPHEPRGIFGQDLTLRFPAMEDFEAWTRLRSESRAFLEPWEPTWPADDLTLPAFRHRVRRYRELAGEDTCYPYFIFAVGRTGGRTLVGAVTLSNVRRGVAQSATLGYWIGVPHARKGIMGRAIAMLLPHAFNDLSLHRVEAACLLRNTASVRLLEAAGFEREGFARAYLRIAGRWEDHVLFAKVAA